MNTPYDEYMKLTDAERAELADRIAAGHVVPRPAEKIDDFSCILSSGRKVSGSYQWESSWGEYLTFEITGAQR